MVKQILSAVLAFASTASFAQNAAAGPAFDVATVKPVQPQDKAGRYIIMQGTNHFVAKYYTLKLMIAWAYDLSPKAISGGPSWIDSDRYDIVALTPGADRPSHDVQMAMLRNLLADRFKLTYHREQKELSIYTLGVSKSGSKLKPSAEAANDPPQVISTVYPDRIHLPARNVTMQDFTSLLQRAVLDRPVVDRTGLSGRFDFDLDWAPDESQFQGEVGPGNSEAQSPPFFSAIEQQLGLKLEATKGKVDTLVVDGAARPTSD